MPVQIGGTTHSFSNPTGLLSDCHRRVETFMSALVAIAATCDQALDDSHRHSLQAALKYFREAAPKHTADEEQSLFPRLRNLHNSELDDALAKLDILENDHRWAEPLHRLVDELGLNYLAGGTLTKVEAEQFRDAVSRLQQMYGAHIALEEQLVFPLAAKLLTEEEKQLIAREMSARRKLVVRDE
jgi:hemerythrin-like domain-containing protein